MNTLKSNRSIQITRSRGRDLIWGLVLCILAIAPWASAIVQGAIPYFMDTLTQFYPWRRLVGVLFRGGVAPYWNPSAFGGSPLLANPQVGVLYPGHWFLFLFPSGGLFTLTAALHVAIGSVGVYGLLRWIGLHRVAAFAGGLAAAWGGWTWGHFAFGSYHQVWAWWPFQWWLLLSWTQRDGVGWRRAAVILGFLTSLQILAGAPQLVLYGGLASLVVLVFGCLYGKRPSLHSLLRYGAGVGIAGILALAWSSPQLIPTFAYFQECERTASLPIEEIQSGALSCTGIAQSLFGGTGFPEDAESTAYFGAFWMALAFLGAVWGRPRKAVWIAIAMAALGILLSWRPLSETWSVILPGFSHMHDPRRAMALLSFAIPFLSAFGIDALLGNPVGYGGAVSSSRTRHRKTVWIALPLVYVTLEIASRIWLRDFRIPAAPEGFSLHPAFGWFDSIAFFTGWKVAVGTLLVLLIASGIALWEIARELETAQEGLGSSGLPRGMRSAAFRLTVLGGFLLLVFAVNRIDLKVRPVGGILEGMKIAADRVQASRSSDAASALNPTRVFAFDPTGHYSYDYIRPDAGEWLLPGLAALSWTVNNEGTLSGVCDLQGYDPALPSRAKSWMTLVNQGTLTLYPRHFILLRGIRNPLASRLSLDAAIGPIDRYCPPILPPLLHPGERRLLPLEERHDFRRLSLLIRTYNPSPSRVTVTFLGGGQTKPEPLHSIAWTISGSDGSTSVTQYLVESLPHGMKNANRIEVAYEAAVYSHPIQILASLELKTEAEQPIVPDLMTRAIASEASILEIPTVWGMRNRHPYVSLTDRIQVVPPGEDPEVIARLLYRNPEDTLVEWMDDASAPPSASSQAAESSPGRCEIRSWKPGRIEIETVIDSDHGAVLIIREPYYRGWTAKVDGEPATLHPADVQFLSVGLDSGSHRVLLQYRPVGFLWSVWMAMAASILAAGLVFSPPSRKKQGSRTSGDPLKKDLQS